MGADVILIVLAVLGLVDQTVRAVLKPELDRINKLKAQLDNLPALREQLKVAVANNNIALANQLLSVSPVGSAYKSIVQGMKDNEELKQHKDKMLDYYKKKLEDGTWLYSGSKAHVYELDAEGNVVKTDRKVDMNTQSRIDNYFGKMNDLIDRKHAFDKAKRAREGVKSASVYKPKSNTNNVNTSNDNPSIVRNNQTTSFGSMGSLNGSGSNGTN